jgi:uncharacterized protein (DUF2336 family)
MADLDIEALGELAKDRSAGSRKDLLNRVVDIRMVRNEKLRDREREIIDEILLDLARQAELELRAQLADQLSNLPNPPEALVDFLINDDTEVARPLLLHCKAISSDELIRVIRTQSEGHRLSIAEREEIPIDVCGALIEVGEEIVLSTLIENETADIDRNGMQDLIIKSRDMERLRKPLLQRDNLDSIFANQMFWWVSGSLRERILKEFPVDDETLDRAMEAAVDRSVESAADNEDFVQTSKIVRKANAVRVDELINHLRAGNLKDLVNQLIAELGVSREIVRQALMDKGGHALALLCKSIGADRGQFTTMFLLIDYQRSKAPRPAGDLKDIAMIFDCVSEDQALNTLSFWELDDLLVA